MDKILVLETSHRIGRVGLALGEHVIGERSLDEARRHARDLVPAVQSLLAEQNWRPTDLHAVFVSLGPGSYTGLRVGIMAAKTLAYAVKCKLVGVETFAAIAEQAPREAMTVDVWADAQQGKIYVQSFVRGDENQPRRAAAPLAIQSVEERIPALGEDCWVTGPGLELHRTKVPASVRSVQSELWTPSVASILAVGRQLLAQGQSDDPFALEPLYLRPSSAEEKWKTPLK